MGNHGPSEAWRFGKPGGKGLFGASGILIVKELPTVDCRSDGCRRFRIGWL